MEKQFLLVICYGKNEREIKLNAICIYFHFKKDDFFK